MAIESAPVNWIVVVLSSALGSGLVSAASALFIKRGDRAREDAARKIQVDHVFLTIALSLEAFARKCDDRIIAIDEAYAEAQSLNDMSKLLLGPFQLNFDQELVWTDLPVPFVAEIKDVLREFVETNTWIHEQFNTWAHADDAYELEKERCAYFGLKFCELAEAVRVRIGADAADIVGQRRNFQSLINTRRQQFRANRNMTIIPNLTRQFTYELPSLEDVT
jgi:hypothetical protein